MANPPHHFLLIAKSHFFLSQQHIQPTSSFSCSSTPALCILSLNSPPQCFTSGRRCRLSNQYPVSLMTHWKAALCPSSRLAGREPCAIRQGPALEAVQASQALEVPTAAGRRAPTSNWLSQPGANVVTHGAMELPAGHTECSPAISPAALTEIGVKCQPSVCENTESGHPTRLGHCTV